MAEKTGNFIEDYMVWPKLIYLFLSMAVYACSGLLGPFMMLEWRLSASWCGLLTAMQGINFFGSMMWTHQADKTGRHRNLLIFATAASAACFLVRNAPNLYALVVPTYKMGPMTVRFYSCIMMVLYFFFQSALFPLVDSAMLGLLSSKPGFSKESFGNQRLFGSIGHSAAGILQGFLIWRVHVFVGGDDAKARGKYDTLVYQSVCIVCSAIFALLIQQGVPEHTAVTPKGFGHHGHKEAGQPTHLSQATALPLAPSPILPAAPELDMSTHRKNESSPVVRLLTDFNFLMYLTFIASAGILANTLTIYQSIFMKLIQPKKSKNDTDLLIVATYRISASISEIFIYYNSKRITNYFGVYWMLLISQFAGIIRIFCYGFAGTFNIAQEGSWAFYLVEVFKGLNSGLIVSAGVRVASDIALPGCSTSAQGLFSGVYKGVSISLAGLFGFFFLMLADKNQGVEILSDAWTNTEASMLMGLFKVVGCIAVVTTVVFLVKFLFYDKTISLPGFAGTEKKAPIAQHETPSTSSFGSAVTETKA